MTLEISEDLVSLAYQSLGYFVIEGRKAGRREIDLLAIRLGEDGRVAERLHVEVSISITPVGFLRGKPGLGSSGMDPYESARDWIKKKFMDLGVERAVHRALGGKPNRVFVYGKLNEEEKQLKAFKEAGVECKRIGDLVREATEKRECSRLKRAVEIAELVASVPRPQQRKRLAQEAAKLNPSEEQAIAEDGNANASCRTPGSSHNTRSRR